MINLRNNSSGLVGIAARALTIGTLGFVLSSGNAFGVTFTLDAVGSGYYNLYGQSSQARGQAGNITAVGPVVGGDGRDLYHNWLAFDLSAVSGNIVGATLEIVSDSRNSSGQLIKWWDITTPSNQLGLPDVSDAAKALGRLVWADAGGGTLFGEGTHQAGALNTFTLNANALASLNATDSLWAIGGQNTATSASINQLNFAFGYQMGPSRNYTMQLRLDVADVPTNRVPEAGSTLAMFGVGLFGVMQLRKRLSA